MRRALPLRQSVSSQLENCHFSGIEGCKILPRYKIKIVNKNTSMNK